MSAVGHEVRKLAIGGTNFSAFGLMPSQQSNESRIHALVFDRLYRIAGSIEVLLASIVGWLAKPGEIVFCTVVLIRTYSAAGRLMSEDGCARCY